MTNEEHKELLEHTKHLYQIIDNAPHKYPCPQYQIQNGIPEHLVLVPFCNCWKSKEKITPPYSIPEKKKL